MAKKKNIDKELLSGCMGQPVDLIINKNKEVSEVSFFIDDEKDFFMERLEDEEGILDKNEAFASFWVGSDVFYEFNEETGELHLSGEGNMPNYSLGYYKAPIWEEFQREILSIIVDEGITTVGAGVFQYCENVKSIKLPKSIKKIYSSAFVGCDSLESIYIPDKVVSIEHMAFSGCYGLKEITLPKGLKEIDYSAFEECENLEKIMMYRNTLITEYRGKECKVHKQFLWCDAEIIYLD